jgi:pyruvate ferredoxin oxidoreductase alpha subunit
MHEMLYIASGLRCPIVMGVANRALSAPINIHGDHSDMMGSRDCGWIQIYCENAQEAYDWVLQSFRIAEDHDVLLPVTVNIDGFILTHALERVEVYDDKDVDKFLSVRKPNVELNPDKPVTIGALCFTDYYFETKRQQAEALEQTLKVINKVNKEFETLTGKKYSYIDTYGLEDAEAAILCLGSTAGTAKAVAKELRSQGKKVGVIKPWVYRPFPSEQLLKAMEKLKAIAVLDRAYSPGAPYGALGSDTLSTLFENGKKLKAFNIVYGLGGRDIKPSDIEAIFNEALEVAKTGAVKEPLKFVGVRE